ncbi:uncharacterized protein ISCGN_003859 [Ixodes scapularis]
MSRNDHFRTSVCGSLEEAEEQSLRSDDVQTQSALHVSVLQWLLHLVRPWPPLGHLSLLSKMVRFILDLASKCERQHLHTLWKRLPLLAALSEWSANHCGSLRSSWTRVCQGKPAGVSSRRVWWENSPYHTRSGTEEQYAKKENFLQEISGLAREFRHLPKVLPRQAATSPRGTTGTEGTQAASPRLSAAAQVRTMHVMRDVATSASYEKHLAAAADRQVDENELVSPTRAQCEAEEEMCDGIDPYTLCVGKDSTPDADVVPATTHVDIITYLFLLTNYVSLQQVKAFRAWMPITI